MGNIFSRLLVILTIAALVLGLAKRFYLRDQQTLRDKTSPDARARDE
jgi:Tfp pilus assembly protein PilO